LRFSHARGKLCKIERSTETLVCERLATGSLAAATCLCAVSFPRSGCRLWRDGRGLLSVLPETGWRLTHSRSRSQSATSDFHSSERRRREYRHIPREGTRRKAVGARSLRAGFLRAEPLGVSFVQPFLHAQKRAGRRRQKRDLQTPIRNKGT